MRYYQIRCSRCTETSIGEYTDYGPKFKTAQEAVNWLRNCCYIPSEYKDRYKLFQITITEQNVALNF